MGSRRVISLVLCFLLAFSCFAFGLSSAVFAESTDIQITDQYDISADRLYKYGLFKGGEEGYDLESESDRVQAAVMIVRLLGAEEDVLQNTYSHPYTDVPKWASNYVGYLFQNDIILTTEKDKFGSSEKISASDYTSGVLSALGYHNVTAGDKTEAVYRAATRSELLTKNEVELIKETEFNRGTMVFIAEKALNTKLKGEKVTLFEKLDEAKIIKDLPDPTDIIRYGKTAVKLANAQKAAANVIAQAKTNIGVRYRSGGKSPSTGFDCSGYVGYTLIQSGVWNRYYGSCDGVKSQCTTVSKAEAKPGDLVFFSGTYRTSRNYTHVGIYLGNDQFIHASSSQGVTISSFGSGYWANHYSCIARPTVLM